jgi:hypothetical protein
MSEFIGPHDGGAGSHEETPEKNVEIDFTTFNEEIELAEKATTLIAQRVDEELVMQRLKVLSYDLLGRIGKTLERVKISCQFFDVEKNKAMLVEYFSIITEEELAAAGLSQATLDKLLSDIPAVLSPVGAASVEEQRESRKLIAHNLIKFVGSWLVFKIALLKISEHVQQAEEEDPDRFEESVRKFFSYLKSLDYSIEGERMVVNDSYAFRRMGKNKLSDFMLEIEKAELGSFVVKEEAWDNGYEVQIQLPQAVKGISVVEYYLHKE